MPHRMNTEAPPARNKCVGVIYDINRDEIVGKAGTVRQTREAAMRDALRLLKTTKYGDEFDQIGPRVQVNGRIEH